MEDRRVAEMNIPVGRAEVVKVDGVPVKRQEMTNGNVIETQVFAKDHPKAKVFGPKKESKDGKS